MFTYGVSFYRDHNRDQRVQTLFPGTPYEQVVSRAPSVPNSAISGTGIFFQDQVSVSSRFSLTGGLRWETARRRLWAEVRARVTRGSDRVPPGFDPLQGFSMFSLRGGCELVRGDRARLFARGLKSVALRFGFENLGNRVYRELFNSVPEVGRHVRVGLDFTF